MAPLTTLRRRLRDRKAARDRQIRRWRRTGTGAKSVRGHVRAIRYLRRLITRAQTVSGISDELVEFVADFEGFYATPYNDPAGFATVGYGHLLGYRPVAASDHRARWVEGQAVAGRVTEAEGRAVLWKVRADLLRRTRLSGLQPRAWSGHAGDDRVRDDREGDRVRRPEGRRRLPSPLRPGGRAATPRSNPSPKG